MLVLACAWSLTRGGQTDYTVSPPPTHPRMCRHYRGRGAFESMGAGIDMAPGDIAFKSNFATLNPETGIVEKRRADRDFEHLGPPLCAALDGECSWCGKQRCKDRGVPPFTAHHPHPHISGSLPFMPCWPQAALLPATCGQRAACSSTLLHARRHTVTLNPATPSRSTL